MDKDRHRDRGRDRGRKTDDKVIDTKNRGSHLNVANLTGDRDRDKTRNTANVVREKGQSPEDYDRKRRVIFSLKTETETETDKETETEAEKWTMRG